MFLPLVYVSPVTCGSYWGKLLKNIKKCVHSIVFDHDPTNLLGVTRLCMVAGYAYFMATPK